MTTGGTVSMARALHESWWNDPPDVADGGRVRSAIVFDRIVSGRTQLAAGLGLARDRQLRRSLVVGFPGGACDR